MLLSLRPAVADSNYVSHKLAGNRAWLMPFHPHPGAGFGTTAVISVLLLTSEQFVITISVVAVAYHGLGAEKLHRIILVFAGPMPHTGCELPMYSVVQKVKVGWA